METTKIYLIRHAHAEWPGDEARPLSPAGLDAARLVADRLASLPITALYSSPSRRSIETVEPLANRLGLHPEMVADLRERKLPTVPPDEFDSVVLEAWRCPDQAPRGGESNVQAQTRGLAVVRSVATRHHGLEVALATHGNLLALMLNGLDSAFGYEFWRRLSFPDVYRLALDDHKLIGVERFWNAA
jgi:2,3-bisphosphoglycerate-dependent phosphoglycerate mutase